MGPGRRAVTMVAGACLAACGPEGATRVAVPATARIVQSPPATDTARAHRTDSLVAEVRDAAGRPVRGVPVRFAATNNLAPNGHHYVVLLDRGDVWFEPTGPLQDLVDTTNNAGQAHVWVQMGTVAGGAWVTARVDRQAIADSARFTTTPGAAALFRVTTRDTFVAVGRPAALPLRPLDVSGNALPDAVDYALHGLSGRVDSAGTVTLDSSGHGYLVGGAGAARDSTELVSVPDVPMVLTGPGSILLTFLDPDGGNAVAYVYPPAGDGGESWSPTRDAVAFHGSARVWIGDLRGSARRLTSDTVKGNIEEYPRHSPDGQWIYFDGVRGGGVVSLWRAHPDGSGLEAVGPQNTGAPVFECDVSPDGDSLVYVTRVSGQDLIRVADVASGTVTALDVPGRLPVWSPDGRRIAYVDSTTDALHVMNADGSNSRVLLSAPNEVWGRPDWSPDGHWLIVAGNFGTAWVEPSTGFLYRLAFLPWSMQWDAGWYH